MNDDPADNRDRNDTKRRPEKTAVRRIAGKLLDPVTRRADSPFMRFRLGRFDVAVRSRMPEVADEFAALYAHCRLPDATPAALADDESILKLDIRRDLGFGLRPRWSIWFDDQVRYRRCTVAEVLPYLEWAINWRLVDRCSDRLLLHAGSVARGGQGVVFASFSGGGKSTLTAGLVSRGWGYLCDEFAIYDPATHTLEPFPKAMCIKSGSFELMRSLGLPLHRPRNYVKAFKGPVGYCSPVEAGAWIPDQPVGLRAVVFNEFHNAAEPRLVSLSKAEAAMELARFTFRRQRFADGGTGLIAELVRQVDCYRLYTGALEPTCQLIESKLEDLSRPESEAA